jgi:hypothetical protein
MNEINQWLAENHEQIVKIKWKFVVRTSDGYFGTGETLKEALVNAKWKLDRQIIVGVYDSSGYVDAGGTSHYLIGYNDPKSLNFGDTRPDNEPLVKTEEVCEYLIYLLYRYIDKLPERFKGNYIKTHRAKSLIDSINNFISNL